MARYYVCLSVKYHDDIIYKTGIGNSKEYCFNRPVSKNIMSGLVFKYNKLRITTDQDILDLSEVAKGEFLKLNPNITENQIENVLMISFTKLGS